MVEFCNLLIFWCLSERNYKIQLYNITLYQAHLLSFNHSLSIIVRRQPLHILSYSSSSWRQRWNIFFSFLLKSVGCRSISVSIFSFHHQVSTAAWQEIFWARQCRRHSCRSTWPACPPPPTTSSSSSSSQSSWSSIRQWSHKWLKADCTKVN